MKMSTAFAAFVIIGSSWVNPFAFSSLIYLIDLLIWEIAAAAILPFAKKGINWSNFSAVILFLSSVWKIVESKAMEKQMRG